MIHKRTYLFFILTSFMISCSPKIQFPELAKGQCIIENDKNVVKMAAKDSAYYKVLDVTKENYTLASFQTNRWLPIGDRPKNYFNNTKYFEYEINDCPDKEEVEKRDATSNAIGGALNSFKR